MSSRKIQPKMEPHAFAPSDPYGGCLKCGMHVTYETHREPASPLHRAVAELLKEPTVIKHAMNDHVLYAVLQTLRSAMLKSNDDRIRDILERACHIDPFGDVHNARIRDDARALLAGMGTQDPSAAPKDPTAADERSKAAAKVLLENAEQLERAAELLERARPLLGDLAAGFPVGDIVGTRREARRLYDDIGALLEGTGSPRT